MAFTAKRLVEKKQAKFQSLLTSSVLICQVQIGTEAYKSTASSVPSLYYRIRATVSESLMTPFHVLTSTGPFLRCQRGPGRASREPHRLSLRCCDWHHVVRHNHHLPGIHSPGVHNRPRCPGPVLHHVDRTRRLPNVQLPHVGPRGTAPGRWQTINSCGKPLSFARERLRLLPAVQPPSVGPWEAVPGRGQAISSGRKPSRFYEWISYEWVSEFYRQLSIASDSSRGTAPRSGQIIDSNGKPSPFLSLRERSFWILFPAVQLFRVSPWGTAPVRWQAINGSG